MVRKRHFRFVSTLRSNIILGCSTRVNIATVAKLRLRRGTLDKKACELRGESGEQCLKTRLSRQFRNRLKEYWNEHDRDMNGPPRFGELHSEL
jgi:hypothetical protein